MSQKSSTPPARMPAEKLVRDIRRATRKYHSAEDKIRIVLEGPRGEESIAALCRREAIAESLYYAWSKKFLEPGSAAWPVIPPARPRVTRSRPCARKPVR